MATLDFLLTTTNFLGIEVPDSDKFVNSKLFA